MLKKNVSLLCVLAMFGGTHFVKAQTPTLSVQVVGTFNYSTPPYSLSTVGGINDSGTIVGALDDADLLSGYIRDKSGTFSAPLVDQVSGELDTVPTGINDSSNVCGWYYTSDGVYHGFFYAGGAFTNYDVPQSIATQINGLNNANDSAGNYVAADGTAYGFIIASAQFSQIAIPGASSVAARGINNLDQVVGSYGKGQGGKATAHGFLREADGTLTYPIDYPGATNTVLLGINDAGLVVGFWENKLGARGFLLQLPNTFVPLDLPKSKGTDTELTGINNQGTISGSYLGKDHATHGLIAKAKGQ